MATGRYDRISVIDAAIIACGVKDYGIPYCAVAALTMSFTLLGSVLNCRSNRIACRSAAALHNPYTLTAETSVSGEGITLLKSRCGTKDFVRRTEEFGPDEAAYGLMAPYLIIISLLLSIIAAATGGSFRGFAHILSGIFVFSAHKLGADGCFFAPGKGGTHMKMVVVNAPKALAGILKKIFRI